MKPFQAKDSSDQYHCTALRRKFLQKGTKVFAFGLLLFGSLVFLIPLYTMLLTALKTPEEIVLTSSWKWPKQLTWENFKIVLTNPTVNFLLFFRNSSLISFLATFGTVLSSSLVAYAFARIKFRGKNRLFILLLSTMMLPAIVTMIPTYVMYKHLRWINTFNPLIIPSFFGNAFSIFLLRQFFLGIPKEYDEAAMIDGATHWKLFWKIILPLSWPALSTVALFAFVYNWRDFLGPLLYLNEPSMQTLELGLRTYQAFNSEQWHLLMAGSVIVMIPLIVIFFLGQRIFVKGIMMGGSQ